MAAHMPAGGVSRRLHPFTVLFAAIPAARALAVPALIAGGVSVRHGELGDAVAWAVAILTVPAFFAAVTKYLKFQYRLDADELVLDSGVLYKQHRVIPLARVQNIDVRQSLLQRVFDVVELRVQTAGGSDAAEAELAVLGRGEAEALRAAILAGRAERSAAGEPHQSVYRDSPATAPSISLAALPARDLVIAGATSNQAGLIVAALAGTSSVLDDLVPGGWEPRLDRLTEYVAHLSALGVLSAVLAALVAFVLLGWVLSIASSLVRYYGFTLTRSGDDLHKQYGLLNRHMGHIPLRRVQALRVEESVLRRPLGLAALGVETAAVPQEEGEGESEALVPLVRAGGLSRLVAAVFEDFDYGRCELRPVHPRSRRAAFTRYAATLVVLGCALAPWAPRVALFPIVLLPVAWYVARWQYRHRGYAIAPDYVVARGGALNRVTWVVPKRKLQTLHLTETPLQRWRGLGSVTLDTAAGHHAIVRDLGRKDAEELLVSLAVRRSGR